MLSTYTGHPAILVIISLTHFSQKPLGPVAGLCATEVDLTLHAGCQKFENGNVPVSAGSIPPEADAMAPIHVQSKPD